MKLIIKRISIALLLCSLGTFQLTICSDDDFLKGLFDGVNFEELLKGVEEALEKEELAAAAAGKSPILTPENPQLYRDSDRTTTPDETLQKKPFIQKDTTALFLDPDTQKSPTDLPGALPKPTDKSFYAYQSIMGDLVNILNTLDQKITSNATELSPAFREKYSAQYQSIVDQITIAKEMIESKKIYTQLFLAPPEANKTLVVDMKKLRQSILDALPQAKKLDAQVIIHSEEDTDAKNIDVLKKLAAESNVGTSRRPRAKRAAPPSKKPVIASPQSAQKKEPAPQQPTRTIEPVVPAYMQDQDPLLSLFK